MSKLYGPAPPPWRAPKPGRFPTKNTRSPERTAHPLAGLGAPRRRVIPPLATGHAG